MSKIKQSIGICHIQLSLIGRSMGVLAHLCMQRQVRDGGVGGGLAGQGKEACLGALC